MRLTDEQINEIFNRVANSHSLYGNIKVPFARAILAEAALSGEEKDYQGRERRGFEVSQPGALPK